MLRLRQPSAKRHGGHSLRRLDAATKIAKGNPSEMEKGQQEIGFRCKSCNRMTDDFYILRDGSNVCVNCVELWEYDKAKQN
jgi:hypothetical protein